MNQPTDRAAPHQPLDALIDEAAEATRTFPRPERCEELNRQLRAAIGDLYLIAQEQRSAQLERSRDWYRLDNLLRETDHALEGDLGAGLLSAAMQLGALARQARALADGIRQP